MNRRKSERPPANFEGPKAFTDNALGQVAYIHLEGAERIDEAPLTGLINEENAIGCNVIVSEEVKSRLQIGDSCFLRLEPRRRGRAVVRWIAPFGEDAFRIGFEFDL